MADTKHDAFSLTAADRLLAAHDGDVALLYIYIRRYGAYNAEEAAKALCRTLRDVQAAEEKLRRMGLWPGDEPRPAPAAQAAPSEELNSTSYTAADLVKRAKEDPQYASVLSEAQHVFGRTLTTPEMQLLLAIHDQIGLPAEVVMMLVNFCVELSPSRLPTTRQLEKEARVWADHEVFTLEQAEEYIRRYKQRREALGRIRTALGIHDRPLSPSEKKCANAWLDMGFGEEAIVLAYDRTVTQTGAYKLRYMDKILQSWHAKNLHAPQEIESGDLRRTGPGAAASGKAADTQKLIDIFNKI